MIWLLGICLLAGIGFLSFFALKMEGAGRDRANARVLKSRTLAAREKNEVHIGALRESASAVRNELRDRWTRN